LREFLRIELALIWAIRVQAFSKTACRPEAEARKNPKGISSFSPGLRQLPWVKSENKLNPNGVSSVVWRNMMQPRWG
jgi:hypothetical protein